MQVRIQKSADFSIIANECAKNPKIKTRAKGMYMYLMTLPNDWQLKKKELYNHFPEGKDYLDVAFNELKKWGYIHQKTLRDEKGKFTGYEYVVYELATPESVDSQSFDPKTENPETDKPLPENPHLLNTKDKQKTKKKKELKTNKKISDEIVTDDEDLTFESVSSSSSFFIENKVTDLVERKKELGKDLAKLGLGRGQINALFRGYPMDVIDEAIFTTLNASYSQAIDTSEAQYFYGALKNIYKTEKSA